MKVSAEGADALNMQILFSHRASWSRVAKDAGSFAFAFMLLAAAAQSA